MPGEDGTVQGKDDTIKKFPREKGKEWEEEVEYSGLWPDCERGKWYKVLHERHKGRIGLCVSQNETAFGHKFAQLLFSDESEPIGVRTHDVEESEPPPGVSAELPPLLEEDQVD